MGAFMSAAELRHELSEKFSVQFLSENEVSPPEGLPTGIDSIDSYLLWGGLPKGDLSLIHGKPGTGATSVALSAIREVQKKGKWAAWINSDWELVPSHLMKKKIDLRKLLVVKKPEQDEQLFWILQELITSSLFDLVSFHLREGILKWHQLQKLKKLARAHHVALVVISHADRLVIQPLFSFILDCQKEFMTIRRASHRPVPFTFLGGKIHANFVLELTSNTRALLR